MPIGPLVRVEAHRRCAHCWGYVQKLAARQGFSRQLDKIERGGVALIPLLMVFPCTHRQPGVVVGEGIFMETETPSGEFELAALPKRE